MAGANASTIPFDRKPPPWIAPPAENLWRNHAFKSGTFHAPGTNASIPGVRGAILIAARKCLNCGNPMSEEVVEERDENGRVIRRYTRYWCSRCGG